MTENEAIELHIAENLHRIEVIEEFLRTNSDADDKECKKNIQILTKINGALQECRKAMEKQKVKKVINDTAFGTCPNCHNEFNSELISEYDMKYCIYCGQAIDLRSSYKPKIIEGKITGAGWPIDGHTLVLTLWDYDNYESWHLYGWMPEDEHAVMETMFITETEAGMCLYDTLDTFVECFEERESEGSFCIPLKNVEVIKVLQEEQKEIR